MGHFAQTHSLTLVGNPSSDLQVILPQKFSGALSVQSAA
jgi:hypothetical protein